jgi:hypothetical protein
VELIGPGLGDDRDLTAGGVSELRGIRGGLDAELLHGIDRYKVVGAASGGEPGDCSADALAKGVAI